MKNELKGTPDTGLISQKINRVGINLTDLAKVPYFIIQGIRYHAAGYILSHKPEYATIHLTRRCNSKCIMCIDWKRQPGDKELTIAEIREIFSNRVFSSLKKIALNGGEPTLRDDLVKIVEVILNSCPQLTEIALITNGLESTMVVEKVKDLLSLPKLLSLTKLTVQVSLDGYGIVHEKIRRVPLAFEKATKTIKMLKDLQSELPFYLCLTCVVQPLNVDNLVRLARFGEEIGLPISFVPVDLRILISNQPAQNTPEMQANRLTFGQVEELKALFANELKSCLKPSNVPLWQEFFNIFDGKKRRLPCFLLNNYVGVDVDGTLYLCARDIPALAYGNAMDQTADCIWFSSRARELRRRVAKQSCPSCTCFCDTAFSLRQEFFYYAQFLAIEVIGKVRGRLSMKR